VDSGGSAISLWQKQQPRRSQQREAIGASGKSYSNPGQPCFSARDRWASLTIRRVLSDHTATESPGRKNRVAKSDSLPLGGRLVARVFSKNSFKCDSKSSYLATDKLSGNVRITSPSSKVMVLDVEIVPFV